MTHRPPHLPSSRDGPPSLTTQIPCPPKPCPPPPTSRKIAGTNCRSDGRKQSRAVAEKFPCPPATVVDCPSTALGDAPLVPSVGIIARSTLGGSVCRDDSRDVDYPNPAYGQTPLTPSADFTANTAAKHVSSQRRRNDGTRSGVEKFNSFLSPRKLSRGIM